MRSLSDTLRSFVRWISHAEIMTLQSDFLWPRELTSIVHRFEGYTWGKTLEVHSNRVFGIVQLPARWPTGKLRELEAAILNPRASDTLDDSNTADLEYYLILEVLDTKNVRVNLAMLTDSRDWCMVDNDVITIKHTQ